MSTMSPEQVGAAIRAARIDQNWSQAELAGFAGVSREWVCKAESGAPRLEFDKVLVAFRALGFNILAPNGRAIADVDVTARPATSRRRVSARSRTQALAEIEKGQQLAGHKPSVEALKRAGRVLDGDLTIAEAHAELDAMFHK